MTDSQQYFCLTREVVMFLVVIYFDNEVFKGKGKENEKNRNR